MSGASQDACTAAAALLFASSRADEFRRWLDSQPLTQTPPDLRQAISESLTWLRPIIASEVN